MNLSHFISDYWLYILIYQALSAFISATIARFRLRDQGNWFILGFVFGVFAVIAVVIMGKRPEEYAPKNNLLLDSEHNLRSGWRFLLFFLVVLVLYYLSAILAKLSGIVPAQSFFFMFYFDVLLATYLMLRIVDRRRFTSVGLPYHGKIMKEILLGFLLGAVMIGIAGGVEFVVGAVKLELRPGQNLVLLLRNFGLSFLLFAFFAMGEEIIFRGYPFQTLIEGAGPVLAVILMSLLFGAIHLMNPDAGIFSTVNTMLAGVWLSVTYLKTRTLYFPFGMHFGWNLVQSFFLSLPVSGLMTNRTIFIPHDFGPEWLTGGRYGPEAGVCTTVVLAAAIIYLLVDKRIKPAYDYIASKERRSKAVSALNA